MGNTYDVAPKQKYMKETIEGMKKKNENDEENWFNYLITST